MQEPGASSAAEETPDHTPDADDVINEAVVDYKSADESEVPPMTEAKKLGRPLGAKKKCILRYRCSIVLLR